jgi:hypothetical protein
MATSEGRPASRATMGKQTNCVDGDAQTLEFLSIVFPALGTVVRHEDEFFPFGIPLISPGQLRSWP